MIRAWQDKRPKVTGTKRLFIGLGRGQSLKVRRVQRLLADCGRRAKLEDPLTPHLPRHTCAKNLVDKDVSLDQVAAILGRESLDTTKIYTAPARPICRPRWSRWQNRT